MSTRSKYPCSHFTKIKLSWPHLLRSDDRSDSARFKPDVRRWGRCCSCHVLVCQPADPPAGDALPTAKHFLKLAPDRTKQPVRPHRCWTQFISATWLMHAC